MRASLVVALLVAIAGVVFVLVARPSAPAARVHDWLAVVAVAATAGVFFAGGTAPRRRLVLVGVAYALFVASTMAWFVESPLWWTAVFVAIVAAAAAVARVRRSAAPR